MTSRTIAAQFLADLDVDGTLSVETGRVLSARGSWRLAPPNQAITSSSGIIAQASFELDNADDRYSPLITTGAIYSDISGGQMYQLPVLFRVAIDGGSYYATFTGVAKLPRNRTLAPGQAKTIVLDCRGNEQRILNLRTKTPQSTFVTYHDTGYTEAELIYDVLVNQVGLDSGEVDIEGGLYVVPWFWADEGSPIELCWRLAAAAGGHFYCDRSGAFTYRNATSWLTASRSTSSQKNFDRASYENLTIWYDDNDLASKVQATASLYEVAASTELWSAREPLTVAPGETVAILATFNSPAYTIESVAYTARSAGGTDLSGDVALTRTDYAQRMELEFENTHATLPAIIANLTVTGQPVTLAESAVVDVASAATFWTGGHPNRSPQALPQRIGNTFVQTRPQAESLANFVLGRQEVPQLYALIQGSQGDPQLELGDLINISDAELMTSSVDWLIIGIDWSYSVAGGFRQDILAVAKAGLYPHTGGGSGGYFVLGTGGNTLGSGSSTPGKLFF